MAMARVIVAAGVVLAVGCGSDSEPSGTGTPGRFVFSALHRSGGQVLYTVEADGTDPRPLTPAAASRESQAESEPEWSPDGTKVAYVRFTDCPQREDELALCAAIWTINADGTSARPVIGPSLAVDYLSPTWSPDGEQLAYVRLEVDPENRDIYVIDAAGSDERRLTTVDSVYDPSWSPDGDRIAFSGFAPGGYFPESNLYSVGVDDGEVQQLTQTPSDGEEVPAWSPDGDRIAYARLIPGPSLVSYQVWVMNADGTNQRIVSEPDADFDNNPVWAADGKRLAFWRDEAIGAVALDGKGRARKIVDGVIDPAFDWGVRSDAD